MRCLETPRKRERRAEGARTALSSVLSFVSRIDRVPLAPDLYHI